MARIAWEKWASALICAAFLVAALFLGVRYLLPILLPFLLAWLLSLAVRPLSKNLSAALHLPRGLCAAVLLLLLIFVLLGLTWMLVTRLLGEAQLLLEGLLAQDALFGSGESDFFAFLSARFPFLLRLEPLREAINDAFLDAVEGLIATLSGRLPSLVGWVLSSLPGLLFAVAVTLIAGFYFCTAEEEAIKRLCAFLPARMQKKLPHWQERLRDFTKRFVRAYLLLLLLTLFLLLVGFLVLRVKYAFLLALLIAIVDLLPVLGVGTVLIPWAITVLLGGNYVFGVGLLILYAVVLIVRQLCEPRLIGKSLGIAPLPALFATYAGWQLLGFVGMLIAPLAAVLIKAVYEGTCSREGL